MSTKPNSCYIAISGSEIEVGSAHDSIDMILMRDGDTKRFIRATKGYEARQAHLEFFLQKNDNENILFLDSDMWFPDNTLEVLRSRKKSFISGYYMRRNYKPIAPVWYNQSEKGIMPMTPFTSVTKPNELHLIGASGWGCVLVHRSVILAVRDLLKGEKEIAEDDMDIYPYDIGVVVKAINQAYEHRNDAIEVEHQLMILKKEIRPLRVLKDPVGSDIRFAFYAKMAGHQLYGDTGVYCSHFINYPLCVDDYNALPDKYHSDIKDNVEKQRLEEFEKIQELLKGLQYV